MIPALLVASLVSAAEPVDSSPLAANRSQAAGASRLIADRWLLGLDDAASISLSQRVLDMSARFIGTPYVHSPLGEGAGVDPDPAIRFDAVDCLTFVEQSLALSLSRSPADVPRLLHEIRYAAEVTYEGRNHLMEGQWIPNNLRKGFLRDITREFGGDETVHSVKVLNDESWISESSRSLRLPPERQVRGTFEMDLLPVGAALARAREIPNGTILLVVRDDRPRKVTRITHLGFVVQKKKHTYLRHAARNHFGKVVDEDLATFLTRNSKYAKWPVSGVSLFEPRIPAREVFGPETTARIRSD